MRLLNSFIVFILYWTNVYAAISDPSTWAYDSSGALNNALLNLKVKIDGVLVTSGEVVVLNADGDIRGYKKYGMMNPVESGFAIQVFQPGAAAEGPYTLHYSSDDSTVIDISPGYTWNSQATNQESTGAAADAYTPTTGSGQSNADSAPAAVDCVGSWGAYGACTNGDKSRVYSITTAAENGGTGCDYADLQSSSTSCSGAIGDSCQAGNQCATTHCDDSSECAALPVVNCAGSWSAYSACSGGTQSKTYQVTQVAENGGTACPASPETQSCEGSPGDACTSWDQCLDDICVDFTCRADCQVDAGALVTNDPCYCQNDAAMKTSGDACAVTCFLNRDDSVRSSPCNCVGEGALKTSDEDTCTGASYFEGETPDDSACSSNSDCVSGYCGGGTCGTDPLSVYQSSGGGVAPSSLVLLTKGQCERYASLKGATMAESEQKAEGCTSDGTDVNFNDGSNPAYAGANSVGCGTAGFGCITCKDGETCGAAAVTGGGDDAGAIELTTDADVDLLTLKLCDSTGTSIDDIDDAGQNYGMVHSLGLVYQRDNLDAERDPVTYCQDQQFVTTIARDASASTSVTTLIAPSLQRSILVHGINWVKCPSTLLACQGSDECYQLKIDLSAREKNAEATSWSNASLSDSFQHQGGANTDNFDVVHSLTPLSPGNLISLVGQCGIVDDCSLSATEGHWFDHTATDQDIVLRGTFEGSNVDSIASIETAFMECPLGATTSYNGELKLGLHLTCEDENGDDAATQTIDSDITGDTGILQNCRSALLTSIVRVTTDVFVDTKDPTGKAAAEAWEMKDVDFKFNRYEANVDGTKGRLISSDLMMQMRFDSGDESWTCTRLKAGITALPLFDQQVMDCDITDLTTATNSATKTGLNHEEAGTIMFDLTPIQENSNDAYEVEVISMLQNRELEQTRRLRTAYRLKTGGLVNEETAFPLLGAAGDEDPGHHDHEALVGLLIAVVCLLAVIGAGLFMCCRRKGMAAQLATVEEKQGLISVRPVRAGLRPRFKNLRY